MAETVRIQINPSVLEWILSQVNFEHLNPSIAEHLIAWQNGAKTPTFHQIEKASKATRIPLGYFFLQSPPTEDLSFIEYRTVDSELLKKPSRDLIEVIHDMESIQSWVKDYLTLENAPQVDCVGCITLQDDTLSAANTIRSLLNFNIEWYRSVKDVDASFRHLRNAISNIGVIVMASGIVGNNNHRPLSVDEFRAFAAIDEYAPLIFINATDTPNAKLFSLIHEFIHICLGVNSLYNATYTSHCVKKTEVFCNAVAAEFLAPQTVFIREWIETTRKQNPEDAVWTLSKYFRCGSTVIARKAYDNGFIDYAAYCKMVQSAIDRAKKKKANNGGNFYATASSRIDHRFFNMLQNSVSSGQTSYTEAYRLTNTNRSTFSQLAEHIGGGVL